MAKLRKWDIKSQEQIGKIRESGKYLTELLYKLYDMSKPGVSLLELEIYADDYMNKNRLRGAFKGYHGFPTNLCTSVNECVVHGIPDDYKLKPWDLLKIDCWVNYQGGISDSAFSIIAGWDVTNPQWAKLIQATKGALEEGMKYLKPGKQIVEYSQTVFDHMINAGFSIIEPLTGHGVGTLVHEPPYIYNWPHPDTKKHRWQPGMVVALEPITAEVSNTYIEDKINHWNLYTNQRDLGAQWEYTAAITDNGYEILSGIQELP